MSTLDRIKADQLAARKARNTPEASLLTTLISECTAVGKNQGRDSTEDEVIRAVKKFMGSIDEFIVKVGDSKPDVKLKLETEKAIVKRYVPVVELMSIDDLMSIVENFISSTPDVKLGDVMSYMKTNYNGKYEGGVLSPIVKGLLAHV